MTNEQLAILLTGIHAELGAAIDAARNAFALPPVVERVHVGAAGVPCFGFGCANPEHYQEVPRAADVPELVWVEQFWDTLGERITQLTAKEYH